MRANEHDLNSLRGMIRRLQEENASLKKLLDENIILYNIGDKTAFIQRLRIEIGNEEYRSVENETLLTFF